MHLHVIRPYGTRFDFIRNPGTKVPGYFHSVPTGRLLVFLKDRAPGVRRVPTGRLLVFLHDCAPGVPLVLMERFLFHYCFSYCRRCSNFMRASAISKIRQPKLRSGRRFEPEDLASQLP